MPFKDFLPTPVRSFARSARQHWRGRVIVSPAPTALKTPPARYPVHDLTKNHALSREEYARCLGLVETLQRLYDSGPDYVKRHGLDPAIFFAGNEWAEIVQTTGLTFKTAYNDINYLRLHAPFAGYHMPILDRLDGGHCFDPKGAKEFVVEVASAVPDDIAERQRKLFDPWTRLHPIVPEYLNHLRNVPSRYVVRTPRMFGEIGLDINGVLVNPDVVLCQSRINAMYCSGVLDKLDADIRRNGRARVLEIGAGHGGLGYALQQIFGERLEYVIIDLPTSLYYAMVYLSVLGGVDDSQLLEEGAPPHTHFKYLFIANHLLDEVMPVLGSFDLALNCMSFPEMSASQIRYYGEIIKRLLGRDGVLFEENGVIQPHHVDHRPIFRELFPYSRLITSDVVTTKNWCQYVWASRYLGVIFDALDTIPLGSH